MEKFITFKDISGKVAPEKQLAVWSDTPDPICFWHVKEEVPGYSLKDYVLEYGAEPIEVWDDEDVRTKFYTLLNYIKVKYGACLNYQVSLKSHQLA